jgi:transposase
MHHKTREMLVSQRTQLLNGLRGHLTEVGVIAAQGPRHARELAELIEACDETIPFEVWRRWRRSWCNCATSTKRLLGSIAASQSLRSGMKRPAD